ncbi:hypothetical protein J2847_006160 [Azospirillum agricola]|uniref:hypothetical protein n=1 Tax=Azospirillum agricola TaxID=1720247 RepID=UPI002D7E4562|nr:hypothetical protein [Azospirillum agricola]MBP2232826.1 hypothetical protein [Azospirillum agricola]
MRRNTKPDHRTAGGLGALLAAVLLTGSCANPQAELALRAPTAMIGMSKGDLLACAGVPDRSIANGDTEQLTYLRQQTLVDRDVDWEPDPWLGSAGVGLWRPDVTSFVRTYRCEASITLRQGRIAEMRYNQDRDPTLCYPIVGNCVR